MRRGTAAGRCATKLPLQRLSHTLILNELCRYYGVYRYAPPPQPARCQPAEKAGG